MLDNYRLMDTEEILLAIEEAPTWDAIDSEVYEYLCDQVGLDYKKYDDPDELFDDLEMKIRG